MKTIRFENGDIVVARNEEQALFVYRAIQREVADIVTQLRLENEAAKYVTP